DARAELELALLDPFEAAPDITVLGAERGIGLDALPELALPADLAAEQHRVLEAGELTAIRLEAVLDAEELVSHLALRLRTPPRDLQQDVPLSAQQPEDERVAVLPLVHDLRHGEQPARGAGVARDEDQLALLRAVRVPLEVVGRGGGRLAVRLVRADERHVQRVARVGEVVRVA